MSDLQRGYVAEATRGRKRPRLLYRSPLMMTREEAIADARANALHADTITSGVGTVYYPKPAMDLRSIPLKGD